MKLDIGTIQTNWNGFDEIARIAGEAHHLWLNSIELDLSQCSFFDANMVAPLYGIIARLRSELNDVSIANLPHAIETILKKNHFLSIFNMSVLRDINLTTIPFKIFKLHAGEQFFDYIDSHMNGKGIPTMSEMLTKRFRQSLLEVFLNASIHSQSELGIFTCGQFYPQMHRLDFSISDAGIGIRENVRKYTGNPKIDSCRAIRWALVEGNTTKKDHPGGLGLKLLKDFIRMNRGKLQIISRFGYYEFSVQESYTKLNHDFPGTCVNIEINTLDTSSYCLQSELSGKDIF